METPNIPHGARVLRLTLEKPPFDVMQTGEKPDEYRTQTDWIMQRLYHNWQNAEKPLKAKGFDYVLCYNGYGAEKPWFLAEYKGWHFANPLDVRLLSFSNGLNVQVASDMVIIHLGPVLQSGNLKRA